MSITVRFAPSPTGFIHIGNARVALWNWLLARKAGGKFILRMDDTDQERSTQEFADAIKQDLAWLGITPDQFERQSDRVQRYASEMERLKAAGLIYPCYETAEELDRKRKRQQGRGVPPVYDRAALKLTPEERSAFEAEGRKPHWRFKLSGKSAEWEDGVRGHARIETASLSDPVLVRGDGTVLYTFASVVDDIDMGVTDIIRGEDHVANTGVQIELFRALGNSMPRFAHHNLIIAASGEEMSKRKGTLSIRSFREAGAEATAVAAVAVLTGTSEPVRPIRYLDDLMEIVELNKFSRAPTKFDPAEVITLSGRILHEMPYADIADRLAFVGLPRDKTEALWNAVHTNLTTLSSITEWKTIVFEALTGRIEEPDYIAQAIEALPPDPWPSGEAGEAIWGQWTDALKASTGRKGKSLFMPLRQALTGQDHGPELKLLLPLMGRQRVLSRLRGLSA
jgi:glutamyl-tRNA synthetase